MISSLNRLQIANTPLGAVKNAFASLDIQGYLVGGFVRDTILGRCNNDIDVVIEKDAESASRLLASELSAKLVPLGDVKKIFKIIFEFNDVVWNLDVAPLYGDIRNDLSQRDFTVNALAMNLRDEVADSSLIDPFGGRQDLNDMIIRGLNENVFRQDPVRLMRAIRIAGQLSFSIENKTTKVMERDCELITKVSAERVREELMKTLATSDIGKWLRLMDKVGLFSFLVPELTEGKGVLQPKEHHWDVFEHGIETVVAVEKILDTSLRNKNTLTKSLPWDSRLDDYFEEEISDGHARATLLKLSCLLHDISKPRTKTVEPSGRVRFLGHNVEGAKTVSVILNRLRFSKLGVKLVSDMVRHHLRPSQLNRPGELPSERALYRYNRDLSDVAIDTIFLCAADYLAARGPDIEVDNWLQFCKVTERILTSTKDIDYEELSPILDGNDLIEVFGLTPGPIFKILLSQVRDAQYDGVINSRAEAIELVKKVLETKAVSGGKIA